MGDFSKNKNMDLYVQGVHELYVMEIDQHVLKCAAFELHWGLFDTFENMYNGKSKLCMYVCVCMCVYI
jgi:hypothetical protein